MNHVLVKNANFLNVCYVISRIEREYYAILLTKLGKFIWRRYSLRIINCSLSNISNIRMYRTLS